jgi:hypothetical protein
LGAAFPARLVSIPSSLYLLLQLSREYDTKLLGGSNLLNRRDILARSRVIATPEAHTYNVSALYKPFNLEKTSWINIHFIIFSIFEDELFFQYIMDCKTCVVELTLY